MTTKKITDLVELTLPAVGDVMVVTDISEPLTVDQSKKISMTNLGKVLPTLTGLLLVGFSTVHDNGESGASKTIDWNNSNRQIIQMTADSCDLTYTDPPQACSLVLTLIGDGTPRANIDADHDADAEWVDDGEASGYGSTDDEIIGIVLLEFNPATTPKYLVSSLGLGG